MRRPTNNHPFPGTFGHAIESALRAATATQVAIYAYTDENVNLNVTGPALDQSLATLTEAIRLLRTL